MAQSALTVTPPSPTPPTNMAFHGATPPNVPNYTKTTYANPFNLTARTVPAVATAEVPQSPYGVNPAPAPYTDVDASAAGPLHTFATNQAASASGTGATSGGTEGTYPGAASGAVPASSSVAHEGAGSETRVLAPGNISHTYVVGTLDMSQSVSTGPVATQNTRDAGPNASHASTLSGSLVPTITGAPAPNNVASGAGTVTITLTGTNYNRSSVVYIDGIAQNTNYVSATSLTVTNAPKRLTAGTRSVTVVNGSGTGPTSAAATWTFT